MHEHGHHDHDHGQQFSSDEQRNALLSYMVDHERSHAEELHEMAHGIEGNAAELIHEAVVLFEQGADKLEQALRSLKEGE